MRRGAARVPGPGLAARDGARGRAAARDQGGRHFPRRLLRSRSTSCAPPAREGKEWIAQLQQREIERTGIKSLKVRYTSVFGYFIEITKANLAQRAGGLHPQANDGQRRALHHARAEGDGEQNPRRGRAGAGARVRALPATCASRRWPISRELQATASAVATLDVIAALRGNRAALRLLPARADRRRPARDRRWPPPGARPEPGRGEIRPERRRARRRGRTACCIITGPNMAGQEHLHPPGGAADADGADRQLRPGVARGDRAGRPDLHPRRRERRPLARANRPSWSR